MRLRLCTPNARYEQTVHVRPLLGLPGSSVVPFLYHLGPAGAVAGHLCPILLHGRCLVLSNAEFQVVEGHDQDVRREQLA